MTLTWVLGPTELGNLTDSTLVLRLEVSVSFLQVNILLSSCLYFFSEIRSNIVFLSPEVRPCLQFVARLGEHKARLGDVVQAECCSSETADWLGQNQPATGVTCSHNRVDFKFQIKFLQ